MDCNCTRIGYELRICTASLPRAKKENWFHKSIHMIEIFMREIEIFVVQHYPQNIFNIELFLNYG